MKKIILPLLINILFFSKPIFSYGLPPIGLGSTNFLDGGPIRPSPGWYLLEYARYYHSSNFVNAEGKPLGGVKSPTLNLEGIANQLVYQSKDHIIFNAVAGVSAVLPISLHSSISDNELEFTNSSGGGGGFGDLIFGTYLQWKAVFWRNRPLFVHRMEFNFAVPTGKNESPDAAINPGGNMFFIDPYWAATLFFAQRCSASWRLSYLWSGKNHKTCLQPGHAFHMNYSVECEVLNGLHIGVNGYFLQQINNNRLRGVKVPDSKERVFAIGPGFVYFFSKDLIIFGHLYFESLARNRPQGISAIFRMVKHF